MRTIFGLLIIYAFVSRIWHNLKKLRKLTINMQFQQITINTGNPIESSIERQLQSLDDYSLLNIFDYLKFTELINLASINDEFLEIIRGHIMLPKYRMREKTIRISQQMLGSVDTNIISFTELDEILRFLRTFGDLVEKITFDGSGYGIQGRALISRHIQKYCSKTLQQLELIDTGDFLIASTNNSFEKLTKMILQNIDVLIAPQMQEMFPVLFELQLHKSATLSEDVLKSLSHLRFLHLHDSANLGFLKSASKWLTDLESLKFGYYPRELQDFYLETGEPIHFRNVRDLSVIVLGDGDEQRTWDVFPLAFGELKHLEIFAIDKDDVPIKLIQANKKLESVSIPWTNDGNAIAAIVRQLQNISMLTFEWPAENHSSLWLALNECRSLQTMKITVWTLLTSVKDWAALLPAEWFVVDVREDRKAASMKSHVTLMRQL